MCGRDVRSPSTATVLGLSARSMAAKSMDTGESPGAVTG